MAAGYMHTSTIAALLAGGADPEQQDRQGRSPLELVESLRAALPATNPNVVQRRMALENVIQMLMGKRSAGCLCLMGGAPVVQAPEEGRWEASAGCRRQPTAPRSASPDLLACALPCLARSQHV